MTLRPETQVARLATLIGAALLAGGCGHRATRSALPGAPPSGAAVVLRQYQPGGAVPAQCQVSLLDADLGRPDATVRVVAEDLAIERGTTWGAARTLPDWCQRYHAWGGVNGGYFGARTPDRKEVVGLLAAGGAVQSPSRLVQARGNTDRFARSVLWIARDGLPRIAWATAERGRPPRVVIVDRPVNPTQARRRAVTSAVGCGPTLIRDGKQRLTDREERLVSPRRVPRTFVAYSVEGGRPRYFVLGVATAMTYRDVAGFLERYFVSEHHAPCEAAMCLDGGGSSQLAYLSGTRYISALESVVTVPTAVLVTPRVR